MDQSLYLSLPSKPGVYLFEDSEGHVLYVGKAKNLKKRVASYFQKQLLDPKTALLVPQIKNISHIIVNSEIEAFLLEAELIHQHLPYFNIKMIDDKSYPFIMVSKSEIPYVSLVRKKTVKNADYFGPYPDAGSVKTVLKLLRKIFPYQSVRAHPKRKCLYFHLGLCPCVQAVPENAEMYKKNISNLKRFLKGSTTQVVKDLESERNTYSDNEAFEKAGIVQQQIDSIKRITQETYDPFTYINQPKAQSMREETENKALFDLLVQNGVSLDNLTRIECFDISNFQGTNATGSMTVLVNGSTDKSQYRKFKIKKLNTPNDFAMHQEMMARRLKHPEWDFPSIFIVDGGKGQVSSVMQVLAHNGVRIPIIGIAKKFETLVIPQKDATGITFTEVRVPLSSPAINLVRRIRDEAHRFAITYHRTLRSKSALA